MGTLLEIIEAAKALSPGERRKLLEALANMEKRFASADPHRALGEQLESLGLVKCPPKPPRRVPFEPEPTTGRAASEIIIEERR